jgi:hypothetical protein
VVRSKPAVTGAKLGNIPHGGKIKVIEKTDKTDSIGGQDGVWVKIEWKDTTGYAFDAFLAPMDGSDLAVKKSTTVTLPIKIKQGSSYLKSKKILIDSGWQTVNMHTKPNGTPLCWNDDMKDSDSYSCEYTEVDNCSGNGQGFCGMNFFDGDQTYLRIITVGGPPPDASIHSWEKTNKVPDIDINND